MFQKFLALILVSFIHQSLVAREVQSISGNKYVSSFSEAKKLMHKIHVNHQVTFYCGCKYYGKEVNMNSCHSSSDGQGGRFKKLEWEHVVPADKLGEEIASWSQGDVVCKNKKGRKCATKASPLFKQMEADLYNLVPESGGINGARSNKPPREIVSGEITTFGKCETLVGKDGFVPRKSVRGEIARIYFYMKEVYGISLSREEQVMFQKWSGEDPVDEWECQRARKIKEVQGNSNRFVEEPCAKAKI